jgi:hypothetical protein
MREGNCELVDATALQCVGAHSLDFMEIFAQR